MIKKYCHFKDTSDIILTEGTLEKIIKSIQDWFHKLSAVQKRRFVLALTAFFLLILTLSVILPMLRKDKVNPSDPERIIIISPIPAGELFLPDEPDFIPGVLLERDRRTIWTEDDAAEHWQNPLINGEEQWRKKIETAIDELLERVQ